MDPESIHGVDGFLNDHGDFISKHNETTDQSIEKEPKENDQSIALTVDTDLASLASLPKPSVDSVQDDNDNVIKALSSGESQGSSFEILGDSLDPSLDAFVPTSFEEDCSAFAMAEAPVAALTESMPFDTVTFDDVDSTPLNSSKPVEEPLSVDVDENVEAEDAVAEEDDDGDSETVAFFKRRHQIETLDEIELPSTVKRVKTKYGTRMFIIGTAHFSTQSHDDVTTTIRAVEPDVVMVELCDSRKAILSMDEETILRESKALDAAKILEFMKQNGVLQGMSHALLLNLSEHITKKLGMAPGGEFRRAFQETELLREKKNCQLYLGDRPVGVTLKRALGMLTLFQKISLCWSLLTEKFDISKEEIEKMKEKDMLETLLQDMAKDYPTLSQVFVQERDVWLAYSLHVAEAMAVRDAPNICIEGTTHVLPSVVVGVVGMGHQPGIVEEWQKLEDAQLTFEERQSVLMELVKIPPPSAATRLLSFGWKAAKLTLFMWSCHKMYKWLYP